MRVLPCTTALVVGCALSVGVPATAAAQDLDTMPMPLAEVSAGYMFMSHQTSDFSESYPRGWYVAIAGNVTQWFSIAGEASGSYRTATSTFTTGPSTQDETHRKREHTLLAGARVYHKVRRIVPFAQMLTGIAVQRVEQSTTVSGDVPWAGAWSSERQTNLFALQPGGGVGVLVTERLGLRAAADYRALFDFGDASIFHEVRFVTGVTFHWGGR